MIEVSEINFREDFIKGKDSAGTEFKFELVSDTRIIQLLPTRSEKTMATYRATPIQFPIAVDQEVLVAWERLPDPTKQKAVALAIYK